MANKSFIIILSGLCLELYAKAQPADDHVHYLGGKAGNWWLYGCILLIAAITVYWIIHSLQQRLKEERIISAFATSLYGQKTVEDIFWNTAKNCVERIGFVDCVIYQLDETGNVLLQKAAFGPKNPCAAKSLIALKYHWVREL